MAKTASPCRYRAVFPTSQFMFWQPFEYCGVAGVFLERRVFRAQGLGLT